MKSTRAERPDTPRRVSAAASCGTGDAKMAGAAALLSAVRTAFPSGSLGRARRHARNHSAPCSASSR